MKRKNNLKDSDNGGPNAAKHNLKLPIIDFAELQGSNRHQILKSLTNAGEEYQFFQLVNHGIPSDIISSMIDVSQRFFDLPMEERAKYMSVDTPKKPRTSESSEKQINQRLKCTTSVYILVLLAPRRLSSGHLNNSTSNIPFISQASKLFLK
ncbi:hypothetical protein VitviT2T_005283 [Vitis vinifera]|uniref:Non-haem dioxygenase N-terminal domain-containing protein n=2 Tax=Vitis vinifera TaxID=29760 RepID=A0ABY9BT66_VITVI